MDYYLPFFLCVCLKRCNFILLTSLFFILKRPNFFSLESSLLHLGIPEGLVICAVISSIIPPTTVQLCVRLSGPSQFDCLFHKSYPMTVFSANLFGRFYGEIFYRSDIACKELSCVRVYSEMGHLVYMYFK